MDGVLLRLGEDEEPANDAAWNAARHGVHAGGCPWHAAAVAHDAGPLDGAVLCPPQPAADTRPNERHICGALVFCP